MTDWEWTVVGWQHANLAASYLLGVLVYVAVLAAAAWIVHRVWAPLGRWAAHRARAASIRRLTRRSGREPARNQGDY